MTIVWERILPFLSGEMVEVYLSGRCIYFVRFSTHSVWCNFSLPKHKQLTNYNLNAKSPSGLCTNSKSKLQTGKKTIHFFWLFLCNGWRSHTCLLLCECLIAERELFIRFSRLFCTLAVSQPFCYSIDQLSIRKSETANFAGTRELSGEFPIGNRIC